MLFSESVIAWKNDKQFARIIQSIRDFYKEMNSAEYGFNPILDEEQIRQALHETSLYFKLEIGALINKEDVVNLVVLIECAEDYSNSLPDERPEAIIHGLPYAYFTLDIRLLDPMKKTFKLAFIPFEYDE